MTPVILTTSKLLSTGVDAPTCKNIVLARVIGSMTEFKQIIGRGTRVREDYGKLFFSILDYTGSATQMFADPAFDGDPIEVVEGGGKKGGGGGGGGAAAKREEMRRSLIKRRRASSMWTAGTLRSPRTTYPSWTRMESSCG